MRKLFIIPLILFLAGCTPEVRTVVLNQCPPLVNYSKEEQKIAAEELRKLYTDSQIALMITDYSKLREACRVVNKRVQYKMSLKKRNK